MMDSMNVMCYYVRAMARGNGLAQKAGGHAIARGGFAVEELALRCANEADELLGAARCSGGVYPAVLKNDVAGALLGAFLPVFYAERLQSGRSL